MTEKKKNILLLVLGVGIITMTVAYAALSSTLNINGSATVQNLDSSWNIHFAHITNTANEVKTYEYATAGSSITLTDTTVTVPNVTLKAPGDKVEYIFKVVNEGDITGYINVLNNIGVGTITYDANETLTPAQKTAFQNDIQVTLTYNDQNKTALAYNDSLAKNAEAELILTIQYVLRQTEQVMPSQNVTFTGITASITYGQDQTSLSGNGSSPSSPEVVQPSAKPTMAEMCPGCVFGKTIASIGYYAPSETSSSYSGYSDGESFLGYIVETNPELAEENGDDLDTLYVKRAFACGIESGEAFCLEGYDTSKYGDNVDILNSFFSGCNADSSISDAECNGSSVNAYVGTDGNVTVFDDYSGCDVSSDGNTECS